MVKWTFLVTGLAVLALVDLAALLGRRPPWHLPLALAAMLALHLAAGQRLEDLPLFIAITWDQTAGFSEAMAGIGDAREIIAFDIVALAGAILTAVALHRAEIPARRAVPLLLCVAGIIFVGFKLAFVRHDWVHTPMGWGCLVVVLAGVAVAAPGGRGIDLRPGIAALAFVGLGLLTFRAFIPADASLLRPQAVLWDRPLRDARGAVDLLTDPPGWLAGQERLRATVEASIRASFPLPALEGTVDTIAPLEAQILAYGLDYRPHPTSQEHQAYTPATLAADEAFFRSDAAPDNLLFQPGSIDGRYPNLAEGALWPLFLARYEAAAIVEGVNLLRRRPGAWTDLPLSAPTRLTAEIGRWVPLRTAPGEATVAQIEIEPTWLGRAVGLLLQPAVVQIAVKLADGRTLVHRLPRGLARAGFILSPLVADAQGYADLAAGDQDALAPSMVTGFQLLVPYDRGGEVEPTASVTLRRLTLAAHAQ